jgi:hypothetical protein
VESLTLCQVWSQLRLEPTIPNDVVLQDGIAHIAVNHSEDDGSYTEHGRHRHRIFNNVPAAHLQPPENVASMQLQAVRFSMDILEPKQRLQLRRQNTSPVESGSSSQRCDQETEHGLDIDVLLQETPSPDHGLGLDTTTHSCSPTTAPTKLKRKRSDLRTLTHTNPSSVLSYAHGSRKRSRPATIPDSPLTGPFTLSEEQLTEIHMLADTAIRLSIWGTSKSASGIKIRANTFGSCLADVAPVLWRPGYLGVWKEILVRKI